ncbi:MAG: enolase C-terminal domain-like protein [Planctomycetaceae bacterium]
MPLSTDVRVAGAALFLLPVELRMPLKFGGQVVERVTCARVAVRVVGTGGRSAVGWGETPLAVQWGWPSASLSYAARHDAMVRLCRGAVGDLAGFAGTGHALEIGHDFRTGRLDALAAAAGGEAVGGPVPELAALIALSPFDLALHDAYGNLHGRDAFATLSAAWLSRDLAWYLRGADDLPATALAGRHPDGLLVPRPPQTLLAWHLVGGLDPLEPADLRGDEPDDGEPLLLADWIARDGLECLKVKLRGDDLDWDVDRLGRVGRIGLACGVRHFCADFNCTVTDPGYVHAALDRSAATLPELARRLLYVEQPFPYDLASHPIAVHSLGARTRLFLDESAHDWRQVAVGRKLGWNGVALKTCKTFSGALLSLAYARACGMDVMVQDLTNPMLAAIPHLRLAAHAGTLAGVETNGMQFCPEASRPEATIHPGIYRRRGGRVDLSSLAGPGFGMRVAEIPRVLPAPDTVAGQIDPDPPRPLPT